MALCLGTCGDPRGVGVSYERGTPAKLFLLHLLTPHPFSAHLNILRSALTRLVDLKIERKILARHRLPPRKMEPAIFEGPKRCSRFPRKLGSRVVQLENYHVHSVHVYVQVKPQNRIKKNSGTAIFRGPCMY